METVQIQCGSCHGVMAVSVEDLGSEVHCPHCQAVVQAPAAPTPAAREPAWVTEARAHHGERDSIFAGPEATDDIFGSGPSRPLVEMPLEKINPRADEAAHEAPAPVIKFQDSPPAALPDAPARAEARIEEDYTLAAKTAPAGWTDAAAPAAEDHDPLASMRTRRVAKNSALGAFLLIILVPYALLATGVIAYLTYRLVNQPQPDDPLERLPDPNPKAKEGGPRPRERVQHDAPLPPRLKTRLQQPLQIGALQVTPVKVVKTNDELVLHLKMKNVSDDLVFNPIAQEFLNFTEKSANLPYTYLDWSKKRIYGGHLEWLRGAEGKHELAGGDIGPGQEELIRIATTSKYKDDVKRIADSREPLLWRVRVRRGFVDVRGQPVSATAVIGVEFNAKDIVPEG